MEFNIDDIIAFIRNRLLQSGEGVSDDTILAIIDIICDFDDDIFDFTPGVELDEQSEKALSRSRMVEHVKKCVAKRRLPGVTDDIAENIVLAELDFEDSIIDP